MSDDYDSSVPFDETAFNKTLASDIDDAVSLALLTEVYETNDMWGGQTTHALEADSTEVSRAPQRISASLTHSSLPLRSCIVLCCAEFVDEEIQQVVEVFSILKMARQWTARTAQASRLTELCAIAMGDSVIATVLRP